MKLLITNKNYIFKKLKNIFGIKCENKSISSNSEYTIYCINPQVQAPSIESITGYKVLSISDLPLPQGCWSEKLADSCIKPLTKLGDTITDLYHIGDIDMVSQNEIDMLLIDFTFPLDQVKRAWYQDTTERSLSKSIDEACLNQDYQVLSKIEKAISEIDWVFGMTLSTLYSYVEGLRNKQIFHSFGRVKTQILMDIYDSIEEKKQTGNIYGLKINAEASSGPIVLHWVPDPTLVGDDGSFQDYSYITELKEHYQDVVSLRHAETEKNVLTTAPPKLLTKNKLLSLLTKNHKIHFKNAWQAINQLYADGMITNPSTHRVCLLEKQKGMVDQLVAFLTGLDGYQEMDKIHMDESLYSSEQNLVPSIIPTLNGLEHMSDLNGLPKFVFKVILNHFAAQFYPNSTDVHFTHHYQAESNDERFIFKEVFFQDPTWRKLFSFVDHQRPCAPPELIKTGTPVVFIKNRSVELSISEVFENFKEVPVNVIGALTGLLDPKKQYITTISGTTKPTKLGYSLVRKIKQFGNPIPIAQGAYEAAMETDKHEKIIKKFNVELAKYIKSFNKEIRNMMQGARKCYECKKGYMIKVEVNKKKCYRCSTYPACKNYAQIKVH